MSDSNVPLHFQDRTNARCSIAAPRRLRVLRVTTSSLLLSCCAGLSGGVVPAAAQDLDRPEHLGRQLVRGIDRCLRKDAFAVGWDFGDWRQRAARAQGEISKATDHRELAEALNRQLDTYGVSHLRLATPKAMRVRSEGLETGAGLRLVAARDGYLVSLIFQDGPAAAAGIEVGDVLVAIDDLQFTRGVVPEGDLPGVVARRRLWIAPGGVRRLEVLSPDQTTRVVELSNGRYHAAVPLRLDRNDDVAWMRLTSFRAEVYDQDAVREAFADLVEDPPSLGLIVDVRSNGGGRLRNLYHFIAHLVPDGSVVHRHVDRRTARRARREGRSSLDAAAEPRRLKKVSDIPTWTGPVVVLMDHAAGSGGDLFPAAMRDLLGAPLIGTTTAGMLLGGDWCRLKDGFQMMVPVQEVLPPTSGRVEGVGVAPDVELSPRETADDEVIGEVAREHLRLVAVSAPG